MRAKGGDGELLSERIPPHILQPQPHEEEYGKEGPLGLPDLRRDRRRPFQRSEATVYGSAPGQEGEKDQEGGQGCDRASQEAHKDAHKDDLGAGIEAET